MLALWRWTLGSGNDPLTAKASLANPETPNAAGLPSRVAAASTRDHQSTADERSRQACSPTAPAASALPRPLSRSAASSMTGSTPNHKRKRGSQGSQSLLPLASRQGFATQQNTDVLSPVALAVQNVKRAVAPRSLSSHSSTTRPQSQDASAPSPFRSAAAISRPHGAPPTPVEHDRMDWDADTPTCSPDNSSSVAEATHPRTPPTPRSKDTVDFGTLQPNQLSALQQRIGVEFSLEILLKHNELRLIDQEIAKCQIALEQLRRCSLIPYPAMSSQIEDMQAVSSGAGPVSKSDSSSIPAPSQPAPWGVVDGPYSRHYARWLLPDPSFDGGYLDTGLKGANASMGAAVGAHATVDSLKHHRYGARTDPASPATKARPHRGVGAGLRLQALPAGYPEHKEAKGPMVLKRAADGKLVKLVCVDCHREDFSSPQGFINHCRIAHSRNLPSHEAAAQICGQEIDPAELASISTHAAPPSEAGTPGIIATPTAPSSGPPLTAAGLVHPLIRSNNIHFRNHKVSSAPSSSKRGHSSAIAMNGLHAPSAAATSSRIEKLTSSTAANFVPSTSTPHLSQLFAKTGRGGDLLKLVAEATTKIDLDGLPDGQDDDHSYDEGNSHSNSDLHEDDNDRMVLDGDEAEDGVKHRIAVMEPSTNPRHYGARGVRSRYAGAAHPQSRKGTERSTHQNRVDTRGGHHDGSGSGLRISYGEHSSATVRSPTTTAHANQNYAGRHGTKITGKNHHKAFDPTTPPPEPAADYSPTTLASTNNAPSLVPDEDSDSVESGHAGEGDRDRSSERRAARSRRSAGPAGSPSPSASSVELDESSGDGHAKHGAMARTSAHTRPGMKTGRHRTEHRNSGRGSVSSGLQRSNPVDDNDDDDEDEDVADSEAEVENEEEAKTNADDDNDNDDDEEEEVQDSSNDATTTPNEDASMAEVDSFQHEDDEDDDEDNDEEEEEGEEEEEEEAGDDKEDGASADLAEQSAMDIDSTPASAAVSSKGTSSTWSSKSSRTTRDDNSVHHDSSAHSRPQPQPRSRRRGPKSEPQPPVSPTTSSTRSTGNVTRASRNKVGRPATKATKPVVSRTVVKNDTRSRRTRSSTLQDGVDLSTRSAKLATADVSTRSSTSTDGGSLRGKTRNGKAKANEPEKTSASASASTSSRADNGVNARRLRRGGK